MNETPKEEHQEPKRLEQNDDGDTLFCKSLISTLSKLPPKKNMMQDVRFKTYCLKLNLMKKNYKREGTATYGVPRGSILGPLLFILLVNDLQFELEKCHLIMYADDTVIYYSDTNTPEIQAVINREAELVQPKLLKTVDHPVK